MLPVRVLMISQILHVRIHELHPPNTTVIDPKLAGVMYATVIYPPRGSLEFPRS